MLTWFKEKVIDMKNYNNGNEESRCMWVCFCSICWRNIGSWQDYMYKIVLFQKCCPKKPTIWWRDTTWISIICLICPIHYFIYFVSAFGKGLRNWTKNMKISDRELLLIIKTEKSRMAGYFIGFPWMKTQKHPGQGVRNKSWHKL